MGVTLKGSKYAGKQGCVRGVYETDDVQYWYIYTLVGVALAGYLSIR
jgi:hypothetical protein